MLRFVSGTGMAISYLLVSSNRSAWGSNVVMLSYLVRAKKTVLLLAVAEVWMRL